MPEVSVIIPFQNRIEWTKEAIQSILRQTYQDFEIILVDDGSAINYQNEIEMMDARIIYLRQLKQGPSCARNTGMGNAHGQFIVFLDSDDTFYENKLEIQVGVMRANPAVLLSHTSYTLMDVYGTEVKQVNSGQFTGWVYPAIFANCPIATPTVMLRKDALEYAKFEEKIDLAEDALFWSKVAKKSTVLGIPRYLSRVRIHGSNAKYDYDKQLKGQMNLIQFGINADPDIKPGQRKILFAEIYWGFWSIYKKKRQYIKALYYFLIAMENDLLSPNPMFLWGRVSHEIGKLFPVRWKMAVRNFTSRFSTPKGE